MNKTPLSTMDARQLIERFVDLSAIQGKALEAFETAKVNRFYDRIKEVVDELRSREGGQLAQLLELRSHPNLQVRYNAAEWTHDLDPLGWAATLDDIVATKRFPWAGHAGMSLSIQRMGLSKS